MSFISRLYAAIHAEPDRPMLEFKGRVLTAGELAGYGDAVMTLLDGAALEDGLAIGIVLRNRPIHAAVVRALVAAGRPLTTIYAMQSSEAIAADVAESRFAAVIADAQDWTAPVVAAATTAGTLGIRIDFTRTGDPVTLFPGLEAASGGSFRRIAGEPGLEILSSGTTGKPKRVLFPFHMLERTVESVLFGRGDGPPEPDVATLPFSGIGGMCGLIADPLIGRYTALLEKFNVADFVDAVRRLKPTLLSGPPTIPRMLIDAKVPREDLASVRYWYGGGAPFTPELRDEFEAAFGIKAIWAYGATEFCGTAISWTPDLDAKFGEIKKGAVGKVLPGIEIRIVDMETGAPLPPGQEGFLEALIPAVRDDWIHTTDIMMIDEDGFAWHRGRGDGAIIRGGFKVLPEKILFALQEHPAVLDAGVIGLPDHRLGQVPVAAVELRRDQPRPSEDELREHAKRLLPSHHVPVQIVIVDELPRTTTLKVNLAGVRALFETQPERTSEERNVQSLEERVAALEATVGRLQDHLEISRLIISYGPLADSADTLERAGQVAALWTGSGCYDIGGIGLKVGHEAIAQGFEETHFGMVPEGVAHVMGMPYIRLDGDRATAMSYSRVYRHEGDRFYVWRVAANLWELVREASGWKVSSRSNRLMTGSAETLALVRAIDHLTAGAT